ncbi:MAG: winged helix-turn-helix domain-containing protein [Thermoanaerobaculia bacterium]|nr:winged helix-turn-helix domain-containing protein [Thermoanaerobaculia bacterium]
MRFGSYLFDQDSGELFRGATRVELPPVPTKVLQLLVDQAGRLVTREELRSELWGDAWLDWQGSLHQAIRRIRLALGDSASSPELVETVPRRGYRFVARIEASQSAALPDLGRKSSGAAPSRSRWRAATVAAIGVLVLGGAIAYWGAAETGPDARDARFLSAEESKLFVPIEARRMYHDGRFYMERRAMSSALSSLRAAAAVAPRWSKPWVAMAVIELAQPGAEHVASARGFLEAALTRDPFDPQAWHQLARLRLWEEWDWDGAESALDLALELAPADADLWSLRASLETVRGRSARAVDAARRAVDLVPTSSAARIDLGWTLYYNGRLEDARHACHQVFEIEPDSPTASDCMIQILLASGLREDAERIAISRFGVTDLDSHLRRKLELAQREPNCGSAAAAALPMLLLGDEEGALAALRAGLAEGRGWELPYARVDPLLSGIVSRLDES